jgi:hypothetical protein
MARGEQRRDDVGDVVVERVAPGVRAPAMATEIERHDVVGPAQPIS